MSRWGLSILAGLGALAGALTTGATAAASPPRAPFEVIAVSPPGAAPAASGLRPIVVTFSQRLAPTSPVATLSPSVPGVWTRTWNRMVFRPAVALPPGTTFHLHLGSGVAGPRALYGAVLRRPFDSAFTTAPGSLERAQQLLGELDYLPVRFVPTARVPLDAAQLARSLYGPVPGHFVWTWAAPSALRSLFVPGSDNVVTRGAIISFQRANSLPETGYLTDRVWTLLEQDARQPSLHQQPGGYTYALATKADVEHLDVYDNGRVVVSTPVNTGIAASPTPDGSFLVYERLAAQVMRGVNPDGVPYADPVAWVAYFNGSDALHYMPRASYGYPQSLGCIEEPYAAAEQAWPYLRLGTVVTVAA